MVTTTDHALAPLIPDSNRGIEQRGIDHIPDEERRGRPRDLGLMWSGIGSLTWLLAGLASLAGPAAGTTTFAIIARRWAATATGPSRSSPSRPA